MAIRTSLKGLAILLTGADLKQACQQALRVSAKLVADEASDDLWARAVQGDAVVAERSSSVASALRFAVTDRATVGIPVSAAADVAASAVALELGNSTTPAVPFLATAASRRAGDVVGTVASHFVRVLAGRPIRP